MVTPHSEQEVPVFVPVSLCKKSSTNHNGNLVLLEDPGRVKSQITSVVCQIQRFDFGCNLVLTGKVIIPSRAALRSKPL